MLVLFDIDATLLTTGGAGITAMGHAGRAMYGDHFDEHCVEYAGRLDPLIIADLLVAHGVDPTPDAIAGFRAGYATHLGALLENTGVSCPCPGVPELLDALAGVEGLTLGLLTGNFPETGALKLRAGGIDPERFVVAAWGCDSPHVPPAREHLPPVAMGLYKERCLGEITGERVTIIGDTPHDVSCAKAHGCRVIGVGTGTFTVSELRAAGADLAVETLEDTRAITGWLLAGMGDGRGAARVQA
jgi:phosphoglycolate phosphatase-like HAD superfamily hydrolase